MLKQVSIVTLVSSTLLLASCGGSGHSQSDQQPGTHLAATPSTVSFTKDHHNFIGLDNTESVRLKNTGTTTETIASEIKNLPKEISTSGCTGTTLTPGESCTLTLTDHPTSAKTSTTTAIEVSAAGADGSDTKATITETDDAIAPIETDKPTSELASDTGIDDEESMEVKNISDKPETIDETKTSTTEVTVTDDKCTGKTLKPDESCEITVDYTPTETSTPTDATVDIDSCSPDAEDSDAHATTDLTLTPVHTSIYVGTLNGVHYSVDRHSSQCALNPQLASCRSADAIS